MTHPPAPTAVDPHLAHGHAPAELHAKHPAVWVTLADGRAKDISVLDRRELSLLQFEQETQFAKLICQAPKGSPERQAAIGLAYDTVCTILAQLNPDGALVMGLDARYVQLVLSLMRRQPRTGVAPRMFEIGYGSGLLLAEVAAAGFDVAGIEVSAAMRTQALPLVPPKYHDQLLLGDLLEQPIDPRGYHLIYWNDVFEHIPPDEIGDFLRHAYQMLRPGGCLVTITPNWHERPSDVTGDHCPPRTEARGLHLKEYTLGEVTALLQHAGFATVETPLVVLPHAIVLSGGGFAAAKRRCEPWLETLPYRAARLLVHGFGLSYTIAYKS